MRDHDRDGLLRPMHSHSAAPPQPGRSGPIDNSTNRSSTGQLDPFKRRPPIPAARWSFRRRFAAQIAGPGRILSQPPDSSQPAW
jgi:hypothetical protein